MAIYDIYDTQDLLELGSELRVSKHALYEAYKEGLHGKDIIYAIFKGEVIEHYPRRRRVLIAGPITETNVPLHIICDYTDVDEIVAVTVYIPHRSHWMAAKKQLLERPKTPPISVSCRMKNAAGVLGANLVRKRKCEK